MCIASALPGDDGDQREAPAGSLEDDLGDTGEVSDSGPSRSVVLFLLETSFFLTICSIFLLLPSSSSLSSFLPSLLPVKIFEIDCVLGFAVVILNVGLISFSLTEDDVPVRDDVEQDQDCPFQKGSASESSWPGG